MYLIKILATAIIFGCYATTWAQEDKDAFFIKSIHETALTEASCYQWLYHLSEQIGGRLSGSVQAEEAVNYTRMVLDTLGADSVWLQPCLVPHWERGEKEVVQAFSDGLMVRAMNCAALGGSPGTGPEGLHAGVIEVRSLDEVEALGRERIEGKVVFFNRPMDHSSINTFRAYGGAVDQRVWGPSKASEYGAVAAVVRSMTTLLNDNPHTGVTVFREGIRPIPAIAISTLDAEWLSGSLKMEGYQLFVKNSSKTLQPKPSFNVIGEIKGSQYPDEIILVGGHLDSWDLGGGAHDDGAGCVHAMEVFHLIKRLDYQPKRTIRCVLFMNEENGLSGGKSYAEASMKNDEFHLAAIESDAGGFSPRGFGCTGSEATFTGYFRALQKFLPYLEPYGLWMKVGGGGADIAPLKPQNGLLIGLRPDPQRYFNYHHSALDRIQAVNKRELELGAAAIMSLVYLIDQHGLGVDLSDGSQ